MNIVAAIEFLYPGIDFVRDVIIQDDGQGAYIKAWNYHLPQPTQSELDAAILPAAKAAKIDELKLACKAQIESGFTSNALGTAHTYDSELPADQTNIIGAMVASLGGASIPFTCTDNAGYKEQRLHTSAQLQQVFQAGMLHIVTNKSHYDSLKKQVEQAVDLATISGISW